MYIYSCLYIIYLVLYMVDDNSYPAMHATI